MTPTINETQFDNIATMKLQPERKKSNIKAGDRVMIDQIRDYGIGVVVQVEPDGRLAEVTFPGHIGWWTIFDLVKVEKAG